MVSKGVVASCLALSASRAYGFVSSVAFRSSFQVCAWILMFVYDDLTDADIYVKRRRAAADCCHLALSCTNDRTVLHSTIERRRRGDAAFAGCRQRVESSMSAVGIWHFALVAHNMSNNSCAARCTFRTWPPYRTYRRLSYTFKHVEDAS